MNDPMSILVCLPDGVPLVDPGPAETAKRDVRLVTAWEDDTAGVVGWSAGGLDALRVAVDHTDLPRLALVSVPFPDGDQVGVDLDAVAAKTLLLFGSADPLTGSKHGRMWQQRLPNARLEMVPRGGHDLLETMWHRVLSFVAPRRSAG